jgi:replicative DNA helicase
MTAGGDSKNGGNREQEISTISRSLKALAKELDIPVIALSQLSRQVENRGGSKRPQLSDLRESGAIEQDADMVMFLYRPEYYEFTESATGLPVEGLAELIIAKHRNGATGDVPLRFIKQLAKFTNYDDPGYTLSTPVSASGGGFGPLPVSDQFSGGSMTITRQSKMNTMTDDDLDPTDGTPF